MTGLETVREGWQRKGIVGHCPVCHRRDWDDRGEVSLNTADGGELSATAAVCGHCGTIILLGRDG